MKKHLAAFLIAVYLVGAAVAYGHAYINNERTHVGLNGERREYDSFQRGIIAIVAAAFWPLYGSVVYWEDQS